MSRPRREPGDDRQPDRAAQGYHARLGITLLVIEHNMRVMMQLAGHIYCLAHGEVLAQGSPAQITANRAVIEAYLGGQP